MEADDTGAADPVSVDTVQYELDSMWRQLVVTIFMTIRVGASNRTTRPSKGVCQLI